MGILDWFKNRQGQFDPDRVSDEIVDWATEKAIALTNPRLKLLPTCRKRLAPAIDTSIKFLRAQIATLPAVHILSSKAWPDDPVLRAFFVAPSDIEGVLGGSDNLRTLFGKHPELDAAYAVLGMALKVQPVFGMALQGGMVQRDVAQTSASFSDHRARLCDRDELRLRRVVGVDVLGNPQRYLHFDSKHLRLNRMNLVLDESSTEAGADINFSVAELTGSIPMSRAFILARVPRAELPPAKKMNFDDASRYL